jgi:hypothetical protein
MSKLLVIPALLSIAWASGSDVATASVAGHRVMVQPAVQSADAITIPRMLSYQGKLTDSLGNPVIDTLYAVRFRLYPQPSGGTHFWEENQSVRTKAGLFSVLLGAVNDVDSMPVAGNVYLGMAIAGGGELAPRARLVSAAYSYLAGKADTAGYAPDTDWRVVGNDMYSLPAGRVGVGTSSPQQKLHVVGMMQADSLKMRTNAADGYVLTSDTAGVGSWRPVTSGDFDWQVVGSDMHSIPPGKVGIGVNAGSTTAKLDVMETGSAWGAVEAQIANPASINDAVHAAANGPGNAGYFVNSGSGRAATAEITNDENGRAVVYVSTSGTGPGVDVLLQRPANLSDGVHSETNGQGNGVYGVKLPEPGEPNLFKAGVSGESRDAIGVNGHSDSTHGVHGSTRQTGTYATGIYVKGGVHGDLGTAGHADGDAFGVVGGPSSYSATGVLGIGVQKGHGVIGIPGGHTSFTTAGVRGFTKEGAWPPFPLNESPLNKEQVGVLGQAKQYVGVWGESQERIGVVGNAGRQLSLSDVQPAVPSGVHGYSNVGDGVVGRSETTASDKAGVRGIGNGVTGPGQPRAAALEIENGAVTVSGATRPAGIISFTGGWVDIYSSQSLPGPHDHLIGYWAEGTLENDVITGESIILLTVESDKSSIFAQIVAKSSGSATIRVSRLGLEPPRSVNVHYLVINPSS